ncbi:MAG TPA: AMP-binding protein [Acidimicrobiales bacterium]|nr:AMP-binding protein [Acidimicrobiales bacterium]
MTTDYTSIPAMALASAAKFGSAPAVIDADTTMSFEQVASEMLVVARGLIELGVQPGDRIVLWAPNSARWITSALGILATGAWLVPLNTRFKGREAAYVVRKSEARVVVCANGFLGTQPLRMLSEADPDLVLDRCIVVDGPVPQGALSFDDLRIAAESVDEKVALRRLESIDPADVSDVIFTSGTTGHPKGVMLRHGDSMRAYTAFNEGFHLHEGDRILIVLPFFHCFGYKAGWMEALMFGAASVPLPAFDPGQALRAIEEHRITHMGGAPTIFNALLADPAMQHTDFSSFRVAAVSAAYVPVELVHRMREEFGLDYSMTGYGLTETHGIVSLTYPDDPPETVANWCGRPVPGVEVKLVDEQGAEVPVGERGELLVRGFTVSNGYLDEPDATAVVFEGDWVRTGDIAYANADGYFKVCDRKKDMFISGGFNVAPAEVEGMLAAWEKITTAAVVGIPDEYLGEVGAAFVIPAPGASLTPEEVISYSRDVMANYKVPRRVEIVSELPLNATGKILKNELRDRLVG